MKSVIKLNFGKVIALTVFSSLLGLMVGVWSGIHIVNLSLLGNDLSFTETLATVERNLSDGDLEKANERLEYYLSDRDIQIDDLYRNELLIPSSHLREWEAVLEKRFERGGR